MLTRQDFYTLLSNHKDFTLADIMYGLDIFYDDRSVEWVSGNYGVPYREVCHRLRVIGKHIPQNGFNKKKSPRIYLQQDELFSGYLRMYTSLTPIQRSMLSDCILHNNWSSYKQTDIDSALSHLYVCMRVHNIILVLRNENPHIGTGDEETPFTVKRRDTFLGLYPYIHKEARKYFVDIMTKCKEDETLVVADALFWGMCAHGLSMHHPLSTEACRHTVNIAHHQTGVDYVYQPPKPTYVSFEEFCETALQVCDVPNCADVLNYLSKSTRSLSTFCKVNNIEDKTEFKLNITRVLDEMFVLMRNRHELLVCSEGTSSLGGYTSDTVPFTHNKLSTNLDKRRL